MEVSVHKLPLSSREQSAAHVILCNSMTPPLLDRAEGDGDLNFPSKVLSINWLLINAWTLACVTYGASVLMSVLLVRVPHHPSPEQTSRLHIPNVRLLARR